MWIYRETFSDQECEKLIAAQSSVRDALALRLLLHYGLRKGALRNIQFKHFDHERKRLTVFTKNAKTQKVVIPQESFWVDLAQLEQEAQPDDYFMAREYTVTHRKGLDPAYTTRYQDRERPMGGTGLHNWWYRCLERAGLVSEGVTSGKRMHFARHTAGQRILDRTGGNLKAAQKALGHASIQTTANVYTDWDDAQLETTMLGVLGE